MYILHNFIQLFFTEVTLNLNDKLSKDQSYKNALLSYLKENISLTVYEKSETNSTLPISREFAWTDKNEYDLNHISLCTEIQ